MINDLSNKLHSLLSEKEIYRICVENLAQLPGKPMVLAIYLDKKRKMLKVRDCKNIPHRLDPDTIQIPFETSLTHLAFDQKKIIHSKDTIIDERQSSEIRKYKKETLKISSEACIPLLDGMKPIGAINLMYRDLHQFTQAELDLMASIGKTISISLVSAKQSAQLKHQATHDDLTGLPNRTAFSNSLKTELENESENKGSIAVFLIDLDRFKEVNDTLGHPFGDSLLQIIGSRLNPFLFTHHSNLCRIGGDEFAFIITGISDTKSLLKIADQVMKLIKEPHVVKDIKLDLGASMGISFSGEETVKSQELLGRADVAMYEAKNEGKDYCLYTKSIDQHSRDKLALMSDLRTGIREKQFILHYQPKLDCNSRKVTGFEALIRWNKLDRGLLYPDKFIDLMEMNELIHSLTDFVIEEALEKLRFFHSKGQLFNISVNVSTRNLLDKDFPNRLHLLLKKSGVAAHHLDLEITESAIIKDPVRVLEVLDKIKRIGIMLSIDDYGTGYSSLSYLKQLPIHVLKIDRSFIMNLERNKSDHTIVSSTIALAHNLGLKVVAEGVETESALEILNEQNCDFAQGYFFSKPIPEELLGDYLKQARS